MSNSRRVPEEITLITEKNKHMAKYDETTNDLNKLRPMLIHPKGTATTCMEIKTQLHQER